MLREQLTTRQDLIESLDSEPIFDYLIQHGVLDLDRRNDICEEVNRVNRNTALLRHLDDIGPTAVGLLINALRQSGQLHLASSLDATHRIRPTSGTGYLGKQRHTGEVTIRIEVDSIKALFPVWEEGDPLEEKYGDTPEKEFKSKSSENMLLTVSPRRAHKSYENMTMIGENEQTPRSRKIREYAYDNDSDDGKTSCWCFCRPKRKVKTKHRKKSSEKYESKMKSESTCAMKTDQITASPRKMINLSDHYPRSVNSPSRILFQKSPNGFSTDKNSSVNSTTREVTPSKSIEMREIHFNGEQQVRNGNSMVKYKNNVNDKKKNGKTNDKENTPPVIIEPSVSMETPTKQKSKDNKDSMHLDTGEPVEICEMWKGYGQTFNKHVQTFLDHLDNTLNLEIIKYFEQDRGTLVLQVSVDNALVVCNICMKLEQLSKLQEDSDNGVLVGVFERILLRQSLYDAMNIQDMKLKVVMDENEVRLAKSELSAD